MESARKDEYRWEDFTITADGLTRSHKLSIGRATKVALAIEIKSYNSLVLSNFYSKASLVKVVLITVLNSLLVTNGFISLKLV
jgi:hypothetical protein